MSGTNPVGAWALPFSTGGSVDDPTSYKGKIDADFAVAQRVCRCFRAQAREARRRCSVVVDAGFTVGTGPERVCNPSSKSAAQTLGRRRRAGRAQQSHRSRRASMKRAGRGERRHRNARRRAGQRLPLTAGKKRIALIAVPNGTSSISNGNITDLRAVWQSPIQN